MAARVREFVDEDGTIIVEVTWVEEAKDPIHISTDAVKAMRNLEAEREAMRRLTIAQDEIEKARS